jgi:hypothetical protein
VCFVVVYRQDVFCLLEKQNPWTGPSMISMFQLSRHDHTAVRPYCTLRITWLSCLSVVQMHAGVLCINISRQITDNNFNQFISRMVSSGMLRRAALVRTDVSEKLSASFIRVTRIGELETTLALTSNRRTLRSHPDEGGAMFLRNVGSYKSHTA